MKELIAIGALSKYEFYAPSHPDLSDVKTSEQEANYNRDYNEAIGRGNERPYAGGRHR